jgi:hypothetical protein
MIGDPTEIELPQAKKAEYVGQLSDRQPIVYWLLVLAMPFRREPSLFTFSAIPPR